MNRRKGLKGITVVFLIFFLMAAGAVQALNTPQCRGKCCLNTQQKFDHRVSARGLCARPHVKLQPHLLSCCGLAQGLRPVVTETVTQGAPPDRIPPRCCLLARAENGTEGLVSSGQLLTDPLPEAGYVPLISRIHVPAGSRKKALSSYALCQRTIPLSLYLKNSTFLC
ncbi:MAG: hypothetical protein JRJ09_09140 [Deltaproteobacteria bacterium]|nr:hypothetical protein [Deltaproteobacteria bacterium]MBW2353062.1 hypothetical protein [Deltaproteobacteria bacterium]